MLFSKVRFTLLQCSTVTFLAVTCTAPALAQQYKTDIPPAITIPDSVDTRLGTLKFRDGFPDDATVQKVYDNLDFQHGVQAFLTAGDRADMEWPAREARYMRTEQTWNGQRGRPANDR